MQGDEQERHARYFAWLVIMAVQAGIFWLISTQRGLETLARDEPGLRLHWLTSPALPKPVVATSTKPGALNAAPTKMPVRLAMPPVEAAVPATVATAPVSTNDLLEQGRTWVQQQEATNNFNSDPIRSRRAQLPGGERAGSFRMQEPMSPARALENVAKFFGDPGPPCPRVRARLHELLTATSEKERALLQEELRRERQFCH